ncbi:helicase [Mycolicibacterium phlei]|uniref:DEAD/DEAH box helicase n=1 Tax=Mycolicibacterium phlei TaxID=1771 RepID=UPI000776F999|nr:DEAD/DEAH box helicase [Mycolicibacterium phlei]VEG08035.1 helicase [Mycobacteroides chelonae]AMO59909.1 ATP-dependent RNA helicase SrmB [Mycolicibacterium phlei]KXW61261.1 DEAD/DEAH box helicase [Mycolicibacterium phlei DSM 43239 = CCUG 21000]KXW63780.1 DEAD/DEAH box helicase [Mycolicibacterium phlei DSM 43070]KXW72094.1 DEAD/DEAH box helicase [Mycolicibacterium phlei DSM 43072]
MGALLPTLQATHLREGLTDYLATTFALTDPDAQAALTDFIGDPDNGMFKGPYVRLRLPFAPAGDDWRRHLDWWPTDFVPYGHQARAFQRLSTRHQERPQPTLVTTGTGSGKTEAFLYPILDHVLRARKAGVTGMKALILYPMNALANDQAERLARLIFGDPRLAAVTAGLYTGEHGSGGRTRVSADSLITDRELMHDAPPDILLTNYKMLDHMLLRPDRANMWRLSAESLQYLVLDEFHTYDGAQGTDVAMLLRRLGLTLKAHWTADSKVTEDDRARPLGRVTPVATSATLGSRAAPTAMLDFAYTVFGEPFSDDAVIGETRLMPDEWRRARSGAHDHAWKPIEPVLPDALERINALDRAGGDNHAVATAVFAELFERVDRPELLGNPTQSELFDTPGQADLFGPPTHSTDPATGSDPSVAEMLDQLKRHRFIQDVLEHAVEAVSLPDLAERVFPAVPVDRDAARTRDIQNRFLEFVFAMLSHVRAEAGRAALGVDVHLWIRELSRVDRAVRAAAQYRWSDDGTTVDDELYLPAVYCRHCGRSGWGARLAPTGNALDVTDEEIRADHAAGTARFRALISAPVEAQVPGGVKGLRWFHLDHRELVDTTPNPQSPDVINGRVLPVLTLSGPDADEESKRDTCPACGAADGIRFLGSAIATQLSVTLSNLFGDKNLDAAEKKALMFTDSVQDAAHRAGFVQARSHSLSLRTALRGALGDAEMDLDELARAVIDRAGDDPMLRYQLLPPDLVDRDEFVAFWKTDVHPNSRRAAENKAKRRLRFDVDLEFGLQSRTGRTLELTGSVAAEVYLGAPHRAPILGRRALERADSAQLLLTGVSDAALAQWVRGTVERIRTRGGIHHDWLRPYLEKNASRYHIWGGRPRSQGMPAFPKGRQAPAFPALKSGTGALPEGFDPITAPSSWYAQWTSRCLDVSPHDATFLAKALFTELAEQMLLSTVTTETGSVVYGLSAADVQVSAPTLEALERGRHLLVCDICRTPVPGSATTVDELDGAPCTLIRCPGRLHRSARTDNFYRRLYDSAEMKRVVAREHTSLLPTKTRLAYETAFKRGGTDPQAPNVLVATPTLEMGIDIGDLSTVMLGSLPRSVASYLQRVGRAGRLTGNSLVLAYVRGRGEHLPKLFDPLSVIQGEVRPPATFLNAEEILQRQYIAHIVDEFARDPQLPEPRDARSVLGDSGVNGWLDHLIDTAAVRADELLNRFLAQFGDLLSPEAVAGLRAWASPPPQGGPSGLTERLTAAAHQWQLDLKQLNERLATVEAELPEFERRATSPAATDDDRRAFKIAKGTRKLLGAQITSLTRDYWISVLERYGVLPNYTLLDDSVTLDVGVTWIDPDTNDYMGEQLSYQRGSRVALTELAPGATFYAQGLAVTIDAVDLGAGESNIRVWQVCPQCGWVHDSPSAAVTEPVSSCPRCDSTGIADVGQHLSVVEMTRVSAEVRRDEATINDLRDNRHRELFTVVTAADIDPAQVGRTWYRSGSSFGAEYLRRLDIRWINLGARASKGKPRMIAGQEAASGLFRVCASCGQLDREAGRNSRYEHRSWCRLRTSATEDVRDIALARRLRTQGVLLHLPPEMEYDTFAHPSLAAAILLGLREVIGGSPEHLDVATISDALWAPDRRALLIHDTVPGGTGYLAEFADHRKVFAVLAAARQILRECPCRDEERLACHRCLLPFAAPYEMDRVSRVTALKLLDGILDIGAHGTPDLESWTAEVTEHTPPSMPLSDESFLERDFYRSFVERLKLVGAAVVEKPGMHGPSATITVQGSKSRKWSLRPQVALGFVKPDFVLQTADPDIPRIAIFTDGRAFHAVPGCNRVADDADKRAALREAGYLVWSLGHEDLQRFKSAESVEPTWLDQKAANFVTSRFHVQPGLVRLLAKDPVSQLLEFILEPDIEAWRHFSTWMPYLFVRGDNRRKSDCGTVSSAALAALDGSTPFEASGPDMCWSYTDGGLTIAAGVHTPSDPPRAMLAVDDRDDRLEDSGGQAWKEWLRLSNWLAISDAGRVTTRTLLASAPAPEMTDAGAPELSAEWQRLLDEAVSDAERELIRALAAAGASAPELGYETTDGEVLDLAWTDARVAVVFDQSEPVDGWTLCSPDVGEILNALKSNGVV